MHKRVLLTALSALFLAPLPSSFAMPPAQGSIVIVFKDGHRQTFSLADIQRIEFPAAAEASNVSPQLPSRNRFVGKWLVDDGNGQKFVITLDESGDAKKSIGGGGHGTWEYVDGEAHITWDDGWRDAIRRVGSKYQKSAYKAGKSFTDVPDNVTSAENTNPKPI